MAAYVKYTQGVRRFAEQWPYLRYLGMGAWWAWIWLCYNGIGLFVHWDVSVGATKVGLMYLYSTFAIATMAAIAVVLWQRTTSFLENRTGVLGLGLVAAIGVLLVAYSPFIGGDMAFAIGGVLTGVGTSVLCFKTGSVFGTLGRREVLTAGSVSLMFSAFLYFMGIGIPAAWQPIFIACLPIFSAFLYIMPSEDPYPAETQLLPRPQGRVGLRSFVNLVLASVMVSATAGFGKGLSAASMTAQEFAAAGAVITFGVFLTAIAVCFMVNIGDIVQSVRRVYAALILFGVVVILLSALGLNLVYLNIGKETLWMVFTCLMAYMVFRFDLSPVRAFGLGQAAYLVSSALFWWIGMWAAPHLATDSIRMVVMMVMVVLIVAVFAFVFNDSDIKFILTYRHHALEGSPFTQEQDNSAVSLAESAAPVSVESEADAVAAHERSLHERIAAIPERFGISLREAEIMELFAQGRSANWIAEELVISKNTVRSHIRSIYTKLDVHTRQELLDFLKTA